MKLKKITTNVTVPAIEPVLPFWQALGLSVTTSVPHGDVLGFAILAGEGVEVMYQTRDSVLADAPDLADEGTKVMFFCEVDDVVAAAEAVSGYEVVVPMRETFYGSREIFVRAPCGSLVGLAQFGEGA